MLRQRGWKASHSDPAVSEHRPAATKADHSIESDQLEKYNDSKQLAAAGDKVEGLELMRNIEEEFVFFFCLD